MKYAIKFEIDMTPEELANVCATGRRCPLENVNVSCPFPSRGCRTIKEQNWKNLKEDDEDVQ